MKRNLSSAILATVFFLCAGATLLLSVQFFFLVRRAQSLQGGIMEITSMRNSTQALANDAVEYARRNPAMEMLLRQLSPTNRPTSAPSPGSNLNRPN